MQNNMMRQMPCSPGHWKWPTEPANGGSRPSCIGSRANCWLLVATATRIRLRPASVALFASLLSIPTGERYPPLALSAAQQRRLTLAALLDQLEALARQKPVLMLFEDVHWADATSLEVLDLTVERVRALPVLVLITFRPEYEAPWTGLSHVTSLALDRLAPAEVETLAERVAGRPLPPEVTAQIVAKTDGVPLFVEELTKTVLEGGLQATELMYSAGGATSAYTSSGLERCLRDVHAAGQHLTLASTNYEMVGQALLGSDMRLTPLLVRDDRSAH